MRTLINQIPEKIGQEVCLKGWAENIRKMGKISFVDLRDRSGKVQCFFSQVIKEATIESVIEIIGVVKERESAQINSDQDFGKYEVEVKNYKILNKAAPLPIPVAGDGKDIREEARLEYRYLDLRRDRLNRTMRMRSKFSAALRECFIENDFVEVETPILTASTMEGARDFVVPSRINPGKFYALPQSPQQYKQLLMTAGIERYFQFAKCIRDEDLRADRGFEFTQVDVEMSFSSEEEIMNFIEALVIYAVEKVGGKIKQKPFPKFSYEEAIEKYGADKFDLRSEQDKKDGIMAFAWVHKFPFFKKVDLEDEVEKRDGKSGWTFTHNPFSAPEEEHIQWHLNGENIEKIRTQQYDLVCNGFEVGGGSVRAHNPEVLRATYKIMGYSEEETNQSVGHMLKAFELGTPPHGGIALGLDRLITLLAKEDSLKESIAFPMSYSGKTAVMNGPAEISEAQKKELGLFSNAQTPTDKLKQFLDSKNIEYKLVEHEPTPTGEDSSGNSEIDNSLRLKALIVRGKKTNKNYMLAIPVEAKLDLQAIKELVSEPVEFENKDIIKEKFNLIIGGVHPIGQVFSLETYIDSSVQNAEVVSFNAGSEKFSAILENKQFKKILKDAIVDKISK